MLVKELMTGAPVSLETEEPVSAAARLMRERNIGAAVHGLKSVAFGVTE